MGTAYDYVTEAKQRLTFLLSMLNAKKDLDDDRAGLAWMLGDVEDLLFRAAESLKPKHEHPDVEELM